jgi:hypothetical protein
MEWWSNGVMQEPIQIKFKLLFLPTLQYSNTPKVFALVPAEPLYSDPRETGSWTGPKDQVFDAE